MTLRQFCAEGGIASAVSYAADHPHAVAAFGSNTMTYDKNGNMTYASGPDVASSYAVDPENRMAISRSGAFIKTYLYDGTGELVRRSRWHVWYAPGTNDMRDTFVDGIYEEQNGPTTPFVATTQTSCSPPAKITKYYTAFGRVIATRVNGVLSYNLADHLGSTVQQIDSTNTPGPAIKYFPFGAPRNGTTSPERAFTGQQREDDSPLGMYYYHARFYSSVLGHFMSADTITTDGLDRYAYVHGNPLRFGDPSGLDATLFCGTGNDCEGGNLQDTAHFKEWVTEYWAQHEHIFGGGTDYAFAMLQIVLGQGWSQEQTLAAFHVAFFNTATGISNGQFDFVRRHFSGTADIEDRFFQVSARSERRIDTLIGYSEGGLVALGILSRGYRPDATILIQPALTVGYWQAFGQLNSRTTLSATDVSPGRIVTVNGSDSPVGGMVIGALNIESSGCGHCTSPDLARFAVFAAGQPLGPSSDQYIYAAAGIQGVQASYYLPPIAGPY